MLASYRHMFNHQLEHDVHHYWDHHMSASFMVDPLGLRLIDQIGVDNVMWSSDYPHNESTFGYSEKSLAIGRRGGGPGGRGEDRQHQHQELPGYLVTTFAAGKLRCSTFPTSPTAPGCTANAAPGCATP